MAEYDCEYRHRHLCRERRMKRLKSDRLALKIDGVSHLLCRPVALCRGTLEECGVILKTPRKFLVIFASSILRFAREMFSFGKANWM